LAQYQPNHETIMAGLTVMKKKEKKSVYFIPQVSQRGVIFIVCVSFGANGFIN
jgi:hypothetical protein